MMTTPTMERLMTDLGRAARAEWRDIPYDQFVEDYQVELSELHGTERDFAVADLAEKTFALRYTWTLAKVVTLHDVYVFTWSSGELIERHYRVRAEEHI